MKLIVGLGNPGEKYVKTRHNVGFLVIEEILRHPDILSAGQKIELKENKKFASFLGQGRVNGEKFILCQPQTFMNASGKAIIKIASFYNLKTSDIWIISDDIDLPLGRIRIRSKGSSAGHKGVQSVINNLGSHEFYRLRIGIAPLKGRPEIATKMGNWAEEFTLQEFDRREKVIIKKVIVKAADIIVQALKTKTLEDHTIEVI